MFGLPIPAANRQQQQQEQTESVPRKESRRFSFSTKSTTPSDGALSRSFSLKKFLPWNKKPTFSTNFPESTPLFALRDRQENTPTPQSSVAEVRAPLASLSLISLTPTEPWLKVERSDFDPALDKAITQLQNDFTSGARQLADIALRHLAYLSNIVATATRSWGEFWGLLVFAAKQLCKARPSMSAAITACLLRALERIARKWNDEHAIDGRSDPSELAATARRTFEEIVRERKQLGNQLGLTFTQWLRGHCEEKQNATTIRILTLSNSSTIRAAFLHALSLLPDLTFHLTILESRPRCEGADMAAQIHHHAGIDRRRLFIHIVPDCAVGTAVKDIDIVLLGADEISPTGNISNKIGSLAAAVCTKRLNRKAIVVALSDTEKIAATTSSAATTERDTNTNTEEAIERHPSSELTTAWTPGTRMRLENKRNIDIFGEWFEWVPAKYIDAYVTEKGVMDAEQVEGVAKQIEELDKFIFQRQNV